MITQSQWQPQEREPLRFRLAVELPVITAVRSTPWRARSTCVYSYSVRITGAHCFSHSSRVPSGVTASAGEVRRWTWNAKWNSGTSAPLQLPMRTTKLTEQPDVSVSCRQLCWWKYMPSRAEMLHFISTRQGDNPGNQAGPSYSRQIVPLPGVLGKSIPRQSSTLFRACRHRLRTQKGNGRRWRTP